MDGKSFEGMHQSLSPSHFLYPLTLSCMISPSGHVMKPFRPSYTETEKCQTTVKDFTVMSIMLYAADFFRGKRVFKKKKERTSFCPCFQCVFMYEWLQLASSQHFQRLLIALAASRSETGTQQEKQGCHQWLPPLAHWKRE